jgi:hypothetical protein
MDKAWKMANPLPNVVTRQLVRIPNVIKGTAIGFAWGGSSKIVNSAIQSYKPRK